MKLNFKCPKCKRKISVGKKLHASYTCPNCNYGMVLSKEDVYRGTKPYRSWFKIEDENNKSFNKRFNKSFKQI